MDGIFKTEKYLKNSRIDEIKIGNGNKQIARHTDGFSYYLVSLSKLSFGDTLCRAIQAREDLRGLTNAEFCKLKRLQRYLHKNFKRFLFGGRSPLQSFCHYLKKMSDSENQVGWQNEWVGKGVRGRWLVCQPPLAK